MTAQAGGAIPSSYAAVDRNELRQQLRRLRRAIPQREQAKAAAAVAHLLSRHPLIKPGARIGVYLALPGELSLQPFMAMAWARHCQLFVPHITHARRKLMAFYQIQPGSPLQLHNWGMPQLRNVGQQQRYDTGRMDVVLVPTVGFDAYGNRLGMGAGFYDRHLARLGRTGCWRHPHLVGVAYSRQEVDKLESQPHDVRLEQIVTERAICRAQTP
jgi:5-formyltetrahydrofolate cyclo-ligase